MQLELNLINNWDIYVFLFALMLITAILAGAYPSIYISSFQPVKILRGNLKLRGTSTLSKILVTLQFCFTCLTLLASFAFIQNAQYQKTLDMGFQRDGILGVVVRNQGDYTAFENAIKDNPDIIQVAGTKEHIRQWTYSTTLKAENKDMEVFMMDFSPEYFDVMNLKMVSGRPFKPEFRKSDYEKSIIINEAFAKAFGWQDALGKKIAVNDSTRLNVIGVVKDFYMDGFWNPIYPMAFRAAKEENYNFLIVKVPEQRLTKTYHYLEKQWAKSVPDSPFLGFYQEDLLKEAKTVNSNIVAIFSFMAVLSIILSGIGLYTLVSYKMIRKTKEIGIRRILGASLPSLFWLLQKDFMIMISIAVILGSVGGYYLVSGLIGSIYAYHQKLTTIVFVMPILIILVSYLITLSGKIISTVRRNPVHSLRQE